MTKSYDVDTKTELCDDSKLELRKSVTLINGCALIIGTIIGSGIFLSPTGVAVQAGSVGLSLIVWALCGIVSMCGALCYAELGTSIIKSGGDYAYIKEAWGPFIGFIQLWVVMLIVFPTSIAIISIIFAMNVLKPIYGDCDASDVTTRLLAACCIMLLSFVNGFNVKWATRVQDVFTAAKLLALAIIIVTGVVNMIMGNTETFENAFEGTSTNPGKICLAFYSGLFAFGGWNYLNMVTEELQNAKRNLPLAIVISLPLVTIVYLLTNIAYFSALSNAELKASTAVAVVFADRLLGVMAWIIPIFVGMSCFGAVNGTLFSASRLLFIGSREEQLPMLLSMINVNKFTPLPAVAITCTLSLIMLVTGDVFSLINYFSFANWLFIGLAIGGLLFLRWKRPDMHRPIRIPLILPIFFIIFCVFLVAMSFYAALGDTLKGCAIILTGVPVYFVFIYWKNKPAFITKFSILMTTACQGLMVVAPQDVNAVSEPEEKKL